MMSKEKKKDNFVLNKEPYNKSSILLTGKNFGCGSSREHAPWALLDFGIKCIIGPSFADIFYNNCFKNSMLPIVLSQNNLEEIVEYSKRKEIVEINLTKQEIKFGNKIINFQDYNAQTIGIVLLWLSAFLTLYTAYDYLRKGIDHAISEDNK